jgi:hypothetical protein
VDSSCHHTAGRQHDRHRRKDPQRLQLLWSRYRALVF